MEVRLRKKQTADLTFCLSGAANVPLFKFLSHILCAAVATSVLLKYTRLSILQKQRKDFLESKPYA